MRLRGIVPILTIDAYCSIYRKGEKVREGENCDKINCRLGLMKTAVHVSRVQVNCVCMFVGWGSSTQHLVLLQSTFPSKRIFSA